MEEKKKTVYMTNMDLERITAELKNKRQLVYWMVSRSSPLVCRFEEHGSNREESCHHRHYGADQTQYGILFCSEE